MNKIELVFTDFDGTLFTRNRIITSRDKDTLKMLRQEGINIVLATGRSLFSLAKVIDPGLPFNYVIFSTGAGIIDWNEQKIIHDQHLAREMVEIIYSKLITLDVDFMIHHPIPDNHRFYYHKCTSPNMDFLHRIELYKDYSEPLTGHAYKELETATQFIVILPYNEKMLRELRGTLPGVNIIRTTSPLDHKTSWIEIFPLTVSKGHAAAWLCNRLGIDKKNTFGIGNDYNDLDLLNYTHYSYVTPDSPVELRGLFNTAGVNTGSALSDALRDVF